MWEWDGHTWETKMTWQYPHSNNDALAYDHRRKAVVQFTGLFFGSFLDQWDGAGWIPLASSDVEVWSGPEDFAMTFDRRRKALIAYGPIEFNAQSDYLWEWDGPDLIRSVLGPPTRWDHAMVYDSIRGVLVVYGGETPYEPPGLRQSLWEYGPDRPAPLGLGQSKRNGLATGE